MTTNGSGKKLNRVCLLNPQGYFTSPPPLGKTDTGGQIVYVLQLAKALAKKNIKVDILTRQFENFPEEEQVCENVKIIRIPCGDDRFVPKEKLYELMPEMVEHFMEYIEKKRKNYDVIHSHYWDGGYAGTLLSKLLDIPHVHTPHSLGRMKKLEMSLEGMSTQKLRSAYRYHVRIAIEQKIINSVQAVIILCETSRIQLLQYYNISDFEKLFVIYPGVDTDNFNPEKTEEDRKTGMQKNAILAVSRVSPTKGLDRLIDALSLIKSKADFHVYIGGGSAQSDYQTPVEKETMVQLQEQIKQQRMEKLVTFIGSIPQNNVLPAYYRGAYLFVLPSRYEPFGFTPLEAMACGTPAIVSSVAGSREVIVDGLNGFVVDPHDRKVMSAKILELLNNPELRNKVSENALLTIREHYSWDKIVEKFIVLYKKLL